MLAWGRACEADGGRGRRTIWTTALPFSLRVNGNGASRPVSGSCRRINAWCGRLVFPPSLAVRAILRESALPRCRLLERGEVALSLEQSRECQVSEGL